MIGLGYVGLPVAVAFAREYATIGYDIDTRRIDALRAGRDATGEVSPADLGASGIRFTGEADELSSASFFVVTVPTPVDGDCRPDLRALTAASRVVGRALSSDAVVCYESTVYPGATEEVCAPILEEESGLEAGVGFGLAYSPERINPGDPEHRFECIDKVVAASDDATLERVAAVYGRVVDAELHRAPSIRVAEAGKVIENAQRDLNIALMNELALIFDRLDLRTKDVLEAAGTKWNFLPFTPGLVGGHCIGVDPYYLTAKAKEVGYHPQVILAGRRINDAMGVYVAQRAVKMLTQAGISLSTARLAILGVTFKENVPDLRNSRVPDIVRELREYGIEPLVSDPLADPERARLELGVDLISWDEDGSELDGVILAVAHADYVQRLPQQLFERVREGGIIVDVKSMIDPQELGRDLAYWSL